MTATLPGAETRRETKLPRLWNVVLLDDDEHTYEYVIDLAQRLFGHTIERAFTIAKTVDANGRAICMTTHRELAELKVEQISCLRADPLLSESKGPMRAIIEPVD